MGPVAFRKKQEELRERDFVRRILQLRSASPQKTLAIAFALCRAAREFARAGRQVTGV